MPEKAKQMTEKTESYFQAASRQATSRMEGASPGLRSVKGDLNSPKNRYTTESQSISSQTHSPVSKMEKRDKMIDDFEFKDLESISELNVEDTGRTQLRADKKLNLNETSGKVTFAERNNLVIKVNEQQDDNLPVFEKNLISVHNKKLMETAKANMNLLKNI